MPCSYPCLLDWNEQIWVSHVQFEIPPVSSRGVTSGLSFLVVSTQCWSQGCPQTLSSWLICLAGPSCLALSLKLRPEMYWFV